MAKNSFLPLDAVPALLPKRSRGLVSVGTVTRWARYGICRGIKLRTFFVGAQEVTTPEAIREFVDAVTAYKLARRNSKHEGAA